MILALAAKSLVNRRYTAGLTAISIALAVALLLTVERIREQSRESFASTISGTDLIVGARGSPLHLLLFSVFRIGDPSNNIRFETYRRIADCSDPRVAACREIAWTIPLSLGDSHRGFRVLGTTGDYFAHLRFGHDRKLVLASGHAFATPSDAVLGADVASALRYPLGQELVIAHGSGEVAFTLHEDHPFRVVGILAPTGTPVDRTIHIPLEGFAALHANAGRDVHDPLAEAIAKRRAGEREAQGRPADDGEAQGISAFLIGLKSRSQALALQRSINEFPEEPLTAILPGVTLVELWGTVGVAEHGLLAVSILVVVVGLAGMLVALLTSLDERRREMAVLRSVGAGLRHVFALIVGEAAVVTLAGIVIGVVAVQVGLRLASPWLQSRLGLFIDMESISAGDVAIVIAVAIAGTLVGLVPAYRIYRYSLADGMTIRI